MNIPILSLLAGTLLCLPLPARAGPPGSPEGARTTAVESSYVKIGNGIFMDTRLMRDPNPAQIWHDVPVRDADTGKLRNLLRRAPIAANPGQGIAVPLHTAAAGEAGNDAEPVVRIGRQICGPVF